MKPHFKNKKGKPIWTHFESLKCGHYQLNYTKDKKAVTCNSCLKLLNLK